MAYDRSEFTAGEETGVFQITGGKMRVSDPCYSRDTWCAGVLENVKNGEWEAYTVMQNEGAWGDRVKSLSVKHRATEVKPSFERVIASFEVGVDSGQAGFFNDALYPDEPGEWDGGGGFYDRACEQTCDRRAQAGEHAGMINEGVVSSSGFGDGGYTCTYALNEAGEVVAAKIDFIPDEDDTEEEDDSHCVDCGAYDDNVDVDGRCMDCRLESCLECQGAFRFDELDEGFCKDCAEKNAGKDV